MANPNFMPEYSTNQIYVGDNDNICLTDTLEEMQTDIGEKAAQTHTHTEYAPVAHEHSSYASASHTHTEYAPTTHEHSGYANSNHTHTEYAPTSHEHSGYAASEHTHTGFAAENHTHDNYATTTHGHSYNDLSDKPVIPSAYTHPDTHPASMITGLAEVATTGSYNDLSDKPTIPSAYTHPTSHPASMITGLADVATSGSYDDLSNKPTIPTIPTSLPANGGNADTVDGKHATDFATADHTHGYANATHTHAQSEITGLETALSEKANTSHAHAQSDVTGLSDALAGKSDTSHTHTGFAADTHNHDSDYIDKSLQFTADNGNVLHSFVATDDVLTKMAELDCGVHTCYCPVASVNAPKQTEAWRFLVHKTGTSKNYGWVMAFGSRGSVYSNYIDAGNWRGWKCIHDIEPEPLWTGAMYMTSGHTVEPTKTLSDCRNGWLLLWSDYDPAEGENNYDFSTTMIPKRAYTGQKWGGGQFLCMVPCHFAADGHNHITKCLHIYDAKIVGHENNSVVDRNDVVLRAVYEF